MIMKRGAKLSKTYSLSQQAHSLCIVALTHNARRINRLNTHMKTKKMTLDGKQQVWEDRHKKRAADQARREREDSLKFFQKMVSKGEDTEQNLYSKVRAAEYSRQKQEQTVRRMQQQLQEMKRKNAANIKKEISTRNKAEMELEQQFIREKAELDKTNAWREQSFVWQHKHRQILKENQHDLTEHEREHFKVQSLSSRQSTYVE